MKSLPDVTGIFDLLAAVVDRARKDARRNSRSAIVFLNAIDAPNDLPRQRKPRLAPSKRYRRRNQQSAAQAKV